MKLLQFLLPLFLFASCSKTLTETYKPEEKVTANSVKFADINSKKQILSDDEDSAIIYTRSFNVKNLLTIASGNDNNFVVTNYAPVAFRNVIVYAKIPSYAERIKLLTLDSVGAFSTFNYKASFTEGDNFYYTESGKWVQLAGMNFIDNVSFSISSSDSLFAKLQSLKTNWTVNFSLRPGGNWALLKPYQCKEYIVLFTNLAYLFSQDEWKNAFLNYEGLYDDNGVLLTKADRERLANDLIGRTVFNTGLVTNVSGLGGGSVMGVAQYVLLSQYLQTYNGGDIFFHEFGHCLGFSHSSNMTYAATNGKSFIDASMPAYNKYLRTHQMPFWNYKILNTAELYKITVSFVYSVY